MEYSDELGSEICRRVAAGESVSSICKSDGMPWQETVSRWALSRPEFRQNYARARDLQADVYFDEVSDLADGAAVAADALAQEAADRTDMTHAAEAYRRVYSEEIQARKLRIDSRKWKLARMNRAKYGDRVDSESSVEVRYVIHRGPKPE